MSRIEAWEYMKSQIETENTVELQLAIIVVENALTSEAGYYGDEHLLELEHILSQPELQWVGSSSDFHNLAVDFSKADRNRSACNVLLRGLNIYPASINLLADFLKYGSEDGRWEECSKFYKTLHALGENEWNWRAYSFSIDYLLEIREKTEDIEARKAIQTEVIRLAEAFVKKEESDLAYFDLASVYRALNKNDEEESILEQAIAKNNFFPRCSLRLADIAIAKGNYLMALNRLKLCQVALKPQSDISLSYVYVLSVLCKSSILISKIIDGNEVNANYQDESISIYKDYNSAIAIGLDGIMKETLQAVVAVVENQTGINNSQAQIDESDF